MESMTKNEDVSIYFHGEWHDLCRGPHLSSTGKIGKYFKLTKVSGNGAAQTSPLDLLLQQQSQGLPFGTDMQSLEDMFSRQGFDINPENEARTAKEPVIPNEQNVKLLDRRLTAEEAQQRRQEGQALSNDLLSGQSKTQTPSMVETYYQILTGESLDVFGTGKSATSRRERERK